MQSTWRSGDGIHVAIIMDGNGRWATRRGLPRTAGHRAGADAVRRVIEAAPGLGITTLTLFAFSSDNWRRPVEEVNALMWLLRAYLRSETKRFIESGARLTVIGRRDRLSARLRTEIRRVERTTAEGRKLHVRVALDYSARESIARAAASCGGNSITADNFGQLIAQALSDQSGPTEVDLLIRTGGEKRLSDFLLWESAYAELIFSDTMWPDFDGNELRAAVEEFRQRERRFGGLGNETHAAGR
ncbi:MAG TPA: di-trans,poly-cis-decaprenylcistransferase [Candidatus Binataceae bacterium]|nr:di-trans,poly-cis-decaprenylcistransferase [Candidatus Binataceae bacterium]